MYLDMPTMRQTRAFPAAQSLAVQVFLLILKIHFWLCHATLVTINNRISLMYHQVLQAKTHLTIVATVPHYAAWRLTVTVSGVLNDLLFLLATLTTLTLT